MKRLEFYNRVLDERDRQDILHPSDDWQATVWATVLSEEVGEVSKSILDNDKSNLMDELVQVAAVCLRMAEVLDNEKDLFVEFS